MIPFREFRKSCQIKSIESNVNQESISIRAVVLSDFGMSIDLVSIRNFSCLISVLYFNPEAALQAVLVRASVADDISFEEEELD